MLAQLLFLRQPVHDHFQLRFLGGYAKCWAKQGQEICLAVFGRVLYEEGYGFLSGLTRLVLHLHFFNIIGAISSHDFIS